MNRVKQLSVWLSRIRKCRGFGVQSPFAYRFIRYVINEHYPYYAYDELAASVPDISRTERKLCRFYFRIANDTQAAVWINITETQSSLMEQAVCQYVDKGCGKTKVLSISPGENAASGLDDAFDASPVQVVRLVLDGNFQQSYQYILNKVGEKTILVLEGIRMNGETKKFWKAVVDDKRTGVTFDLYDCGIVFFDKKRTKQHYVVNF